jgi:hypothetical protein
MDETEKERQEETPASKASSRKLTLVMIGFFAGLILLLALNMN